MTVGDDSSRFASVHQHYDAIIHEEEEIICGWPTDSVTINAHVHDDDSSSNSAMKVDGMFRCYTMSNVCCSCDIFVLE